MREERVDAGLVRLSDVKRETSEVTFFKISFSSLLMALHRGAVIVV